MDGFTSVLFDMYSFYANISNFVFNIYGNFAFSHKRMIKLAYLISLWEIRIKIIFSVKL